MTALHSRVLYQGCPLCGDTQRTEIAVGDCSGHALYKPSLPRHQRWLRCGACAHEYVDGYFGPDALTVLFSDTHANQLPGHDIENARYTWARIVEYVSALRPALGGRWLDVGFGNGGLLTTAEEFGYEVVGLDLRRESVRLMQALGYAAHDVSLEDYRADRPFDVLSMADVLEHMPFPKRGLQRARELLSPEGLLLVSMPNSDSFLWKILSKNGVNPYWGEIEHYHNFGRARLYALLEEHGFTPIRYGVSLRYRACMEVVARKR